MVACGHWFRREHDALDSRLHEPKARVWVERSDSKPSARRPASGLAVWSEPRGQSLGEEWRYELFGPPDITLDRERRAFVIRPSVAVPLPSPHGEAAPELVEVTPEPYRVQLVGSIGEETDRRAILINTHTQETFLARANQRFEELGLLVRRVGLNKVLVRLDEFGPVHDVVLEALLFDEQSAEDVLLTSGVKQLTGRLRAVVKWEGNRVELVEGAVFPTGDWVGRVARIRSDPDEVFINRTRHGMTHSELWVLRRAQGALIQPAEIMIETPAEQPRIAKHQP